MVAMTGDEIDKGGGGRASNRVPIKELMAVFQNLGDRCEFGLVQRYCGSEPLHLLRWMRTRPEPLLRALHERFDGFGEPEQTTISLAPHREYYVKDTKFDINGHTFIHERQLSCSRALDQQRARLSYLKRRLIEDLEAGEHIFVYKTDPPADPALRKRLHEAIRIYGGSTLLWVTIAEAAEAVGTAEMLIQGYVDRFADLADLAHSISLDAWIRVCRNAHALWVVHRDARPSYASAPGFGREGRDGRG